MVWDLELTGGTSRPCPQITLPWRSIRIGTLKPKTSMLLAICRICFLLWRRGLVASTLPALACSGALEMLNPQMNSRGAVKHRPRPASVAEPTISPDSLLEEEDSNFWSHLQRGWPYRARPSFFRARLYRLRSF